MTNAELHKFIEVSGELTLSLIKLLDARYSGNKDDIDFAQGKIVDVLSEIKIRMEAWN